MGRLPFVDKEAAFPGPKAQGLARVGELLSGSRAKHLAERVSRFEEGAAHWAKRPPRSAVEDLGKRRAGEHLDLARKSLKDENLKVLGTRAGAGASVAAGGYALTRSRDKDKTASLMPEKGLGRAVQLLTGSRLRGMEEQVASRTGAAARHNNSARRIFQSAFEGGAPREKDFVRESYRTGALRQGAERAARATEGERSAVQGARRTALGAGALGAAGLAIGSQAGTQDKTAATMPVSTSMLQGVTDATGRMGEKSLLEAASNSVDPVINLTRSLTKKPLLSTGTKVLGGAGLAGLGLGAALAHHHSKEAATKEAIGLPGMGGFGGALMSGAKGMGNFAMNAGKSIAGAARAGGTQAASQAALSAGRSGLMRAGNFISKNPAAGAALVAAPALAAGYAAGRQ